MLQYTLSIIPYANIVFTNVFYNMETAVLMYFQAIYTCKLFGQDFQMKSLTLSLEENLIQRGSSLMTFFTSFHVVVKVI